MPSIVSIIVTYQPDLAVLAKLITKLHQQGTCVLIVDNGSSENIDEWNHLQPVRADKVICLGENFGIARAHNAGIDWADAQGAPYVLLMDQDSIPEFGMVSALLKQAETAESVGAVGPRYVDSRRQYNQPPFMQVKGFTLVRHACNPATNAVPVDYLISSGSLISIATLKAVGGMREDLFIDYVDIEWGLRAQKKGFQSYGVCSANMQHSLGENPVTLFNRSIPVHSPIRHYYHFRNAVLLYRSPWPPLNWKVVDGIRLILRYGFYTLFAKPRLTHWRMMSLGLFHGLINRTGRF